MYSSSNKVRTVAGIGTLVVSRETGGLVRCVIRVSIILAHSSLVISKPSDAWNDVICDSIDFIEQSVLKAVLHVISFLHFFVILLHFGFLIGLGGWAAITQAQSRAEGKVYNLSHSLSKYLSRFSFRLA